MYNELGQTRLKDGPATVARIDGPDVEWGERLVPFLQHKGRPWNWQIRETLLGDVGRLGAHYYIAHRGEEILSNVANWEHAGAGNFGHVFTQPEHRRKGACKAIMDLQMADFRRRGGRALFLNTGYTSVAYYIYRSFGFESVFPESGYMHYYSKDQASFERAYYAEGAARIRDIEWADWASLSTLLSSSQGAHLRLSSACINGRYLFEHGFLDFYQGLLGDPRRRASVAEVESSHSVVGVAHLEPDARFGGAVDVVDLFVHPRHADKAAPLLSSLEVDPSRKTQAYVGSDDGPGRAAFEAAGFKPEAVLKNQLASPAGTLDVTIFSR